MAIGFGLVYFLGVPLSIFLLLYCNRRRLEKRRFQTRFGFLYDGYVVDRGAVLAWESVVMLRKMLIVVVAVSTKDPYIQVLLAIVIMVFATVLHLRYRPYNSTLLNNLETAALLAVLFTQILSLLYLHEELIASQKALAGGVFDEYTGDATPLEIFITVLLVLINAGVILLLLGAMVYLFFVGRRWQRETFKERIAAKKRRRANRVTELAARLALEKSAYAASSRRPSMMMDDAAIAACVEEEMRLERVKIEEEMEEEQTAQLLRLKAELADRTDMVVNLRRELDTARRRGDAVSSADLERVALMEDEYTQGRREIDNALESLRADQTERMQRRLAQRRDLRTRQLRARKDRRRQELMQHVRSLHRLHSQLNMAEAQYHHISHVHQDDDDDPSSLSNHPECTLRSQTRLEVSDILRAHYGSRIQGLAAQMIGQDDGITDGEDDENGTFSPATDRFAV